MEPCTNENQITVKYYESLKEMDDPRAVCVVHKVGSLIWVTYHLRRY